MTKNPKILVIDDDDAMRESCCMVFDKDGYEAIGAEDGFKGLELVTDKKPDLVLVDLKMPGISGMEVLERLRDMDSDIVSIVITGYATIDSAIEAMKKGAYDYLPKPFSPDELRMITRRAIEKRELIQRSKELELEKEKMKEKYISMVTHQLKSPIAAVQEYLEVILGNMAGEVQPEQRKMLERSKVRLNGLLALIKNWLSLSRIDSDSLTQNFEQVNIMDILKKAIESVKPLASKKGVTIQFEHIQDFPELKGDAGALLQAFVNLLDNGIKYNKDNGTIKVSVIRDKCFLRIDFSDTGVGMPEGKIPFIFEEFYKCSENVKDRVDSNGLGLSIVKRIIDAHSGIIDVKSKQGEGSVFSVYLPLPRVKED